MGNFPPAPKNALLETIKVSLAQPIFFNTSPITISDCPREYISALSKKLIPAVFTGSVFMFLAVLFGALGSHALKARLTPDALQSYMIAIRYMLFHGVAILALVSLPFLDETLKGRIAFLLVAGVIVFTQ